jgi:phosphohistidine phosphatase
MFNAPAAGQTHTQLYTLPVRDARPICARAEQTARIACAEIGVEVELTEALRGGDFDPVPLVSGLGRVLLVGHEPDFSRAVARATGARVELEKGGLAAIEDSRLIALLRPGALREIAAP